MSTGETRNVIKRFASTHRRHLEPPERERRETKTKPTTIDSLDRKPHNCVRLQLQLVVLINRIGMSLIGGRASWPTSEVAP